MHCSKALTDISVATWRVLIHFICNIYFNEKYKLKYVINSLKYSTFFSMKPKQDCSKMNNSKLPHVLVDYC